ncbi:tetratricopeptide repeat protein [Thalassotalea profundi]|uniref:Tetratricopeptide repeat protein n=1 Tax=Thalassotalea profundi TaxID=2036687 RepID=A0ABQ3ID76_9GAMM|nr:hypothetical protein [Thalassotalea profundi]GHE78992.1 hypothetical protein GCM10011501_03640 [Thalassotalea profundi]
MHWQQLMSKGNNFFETQQWGKAESYYKSVFSQLEGQWERGKDNESLLMAWICSCHNLATLFETKGDYESAIGYLVQAYQQAYSISQNPNLTHSLRYLAFNALKTTLNPILIFSTKYPTCENCLEQLRRLQLTLEAEVYTVH